MLQIFPLICHLPFNFVYNVFLYLCRVKFIAFPFMVFAFAFYVIGAVRISK